MIRNNNIKKKILYLFQFTSGQLGLQLINLINGFMLIRWLSVSEQAKFSLAFSIQNFITSLSDLGFTSSIIALVGVEINDKKKIGAYVSAAKRLRNNLLIISVLIAIFALPSIVKIQNWDFGELGFLLLPVLLSVYLQADFSLYSAVLIMKKKMNDLYRPQIFFSFLKLLLNWIISFLTNLEAIFILIINSIFLFYSIFFLKKKSSAYLTYPHNGFESEKKEMVTYLKPLMPNLILNAFMGQIQVFIISLFGKTNNIAEVAVLSKFAQIFIFFNAINGNIILPFIAKIPNEKLGLNYVKILILSLVLSFFILLTVFYFPDLYLFILGDKYQHLKKEIFIVVLNSCISYIGGVMWAMHSGRKWIFWWGSLAYVICTIGCQLVGIYLFDLSSTIGVLYISTISNTGLLLVHCIYGFIGFRKLKYETSC